MPEVSLKPNTSLILISLWTMGFQQWKKIHQICLDLTWNLLNSLQDLNEIKACLTPLRLFLVLLCFCINRKAQCNKQKVSNNFGNNSKLVNLILLNLISIIHKA